MIQICVTFLPWLSIDNEKSDKVELRTFICWWYFYHFPNKKCMTANRYSYSFYSWRVFLCGLFLISIHLSIRYSLDWTILQSLKFEISSGHESLCMFMLVFQVWPISIGLLVLLRSYRKRIKLLRYKKAPYIIIYMFNCQFIQSTAS